MYITRRRDKADNRQGYKLGYNPRKGNYNKCSQNIKREATKMKRKVLSLLIATAMIATTLVGCGSTPAAAPAEEAPAAEAPAAEAEAPAAEEPAAETEVAASELPEGALVYLVSKGFQHQFWQAVNQGAQEAADELGVKMVMEGPATESDIQDQVQMLNNAINQKPVAIGLAALDTEACLEGIKTAQAAGIPIIGFDSGVPDAPEGAIFANAATDNYKAGELAADETFKIIGESIKSATAPVRIGVLSQDATSESIVSRGVGFVDKMKTLVEAAGKKVSVEGHEKFSADKKVDGADVIIEVLVPAQVTAELSTIDGQNLLNKKDLIAIYGSNQHSGEAVVNADANLKKLGKLEDGKVVGVAFDSGSVIKGAVKDGTLVGAVTQDPLSIGRKTVELAVAAAKGEKVADVDTGCQWFTAENMEDPKIAPNLYD